MIPLPKVQLLSSCEEDGKPDSLASRIKSFPAIGCSIVSISPY